MIEGEVDSGADACILRPIRVGRSANAGVVPDMPAGAVVGGIPARPLRSSHVQSGQQ